MSLGLKTETHIIALIWDLQKNMSFCVHIVQRYILDTKAPERSGSWCGGGPVSESRIKSKRLV